MPPSFFSETVHAVIMEFMFIMCTFFTKLRLFFFHEVSFIFGTFSPRLRETLYVGRVNFAEASERAVFQLVVRRTASSEFIVQGA